MPASVRRIMEPRDTFPEFAVCFRSFIARVVSVAVDGVVGGEDVAEVMHEDNSRRAALEKPNPKATHDPGSRDEPGEASVLLRVGRNKRRDSARSSRLKNRKVPPATSHHSLWWVGNCSCFEPREGGMLWFGADGARFG